MFSIHRYTRKITFYANPSASFALLKIAPLTCTVLVMWRACAMPMTSLSNFHEVLGGQNGVGSSGHEEGKCEFISLVW
jgi:hypothetical protein